MTSLIYIHMWMKKSIQRTSHLPFNNNQTFRPFGLLQYKVVRAANNTWTLVNSPYNFVLKKPEWAKRLHCY